MLENLEIDAGITYLENEPLGRVTSVPLYAERYHLITAAGSPLSDRDNVTWSRISNPFRDLSTFRRSPASALGDRLRRRAEPSSHENFIALPCLSPDPKDSLIPQLP